MKSSMLKTAVLLAGGVAALDVARRFARRVPRDNTIVIFETIGRVPGKKRDGLFIGYPVHATGAIDPDIDDVRSRKIAKEIRKGVREADKWLRSTTREDGKRRANKTLGGNRNAVCEFVLVKRSRGAKGKVIGVTRRCFTRGETFTAEERITETGPAPLPPIPAVLPAFPTNPMGDPLYKD